MHRKGINYDTGFAPIGDGLSRETFEPAQVRREIEIIARDVHCNAVRISGRDADRIALTLLRENPIPGGVSPQGWASGAVYEATFRMNEKRGQREIGRVFSVSEVTVRKCFAAFPHKEKGGR